jgi:hypothetical protein
MEKNFFESPNVNEVKSNQAEKDNENKKKEEKKFQPEFLPYLPEAEEFLRFSTGIFNTIAGNPDPPLEFFLENSGFYFDHRNGRVAVSLKHFVEMKKEGSSREMIEWAMGHEIKHHADMTEDPEGYLGNFERNKEKAKNRAGEALDMLRQNNKDVPSYVDEKWMTQFLGKQIHELYNCLDDIFVNRAVANHFQRFSKEGILGREVRDFYAQKLFPGKQLESGETIVDYSKLPKSKQLAYYFLRKFMVPDEEILVNMEVREKIYGFVDKFAEKYGKRTIDEVYEKTRPTGKYEKQQNIASARYSWIEKNIEPIFWELLFEDLKNMPIPPKKEGEPQKGEGGESSGDPGEPQEGDSNNEDADDDAKKENEGNKEKGKTDKKDAGQDGEEDNVAENAEGEGNEDTESPWESKVDANPISEEEVREFIEQQKEKEREKRKAENERKQWDRLSPEDKSANRRKQADFELAKREGITQSEVVAYHHLQESVEKYKRELSEVFEKVMKNIQERLSFEWEKYQRKGQFNVNDFVNKYGADIASGHLENIPFDKLDIFEQKDFIKKLHLMPNKIRVRLILDGSGSMTQGEDKINIVRQISVLIMEALKEFETRMNLKFRMDKKFFVDTQIIMFGSKGKTAVVKNFEADESSQDVKTARMKAVGKINSGYGSTYDAEAWEKVDASVDYAEDIRNGKMREFCFEVTDGGSDSGSEQTVRNALDNLSRKKVVTKGIQVGSSVSENDKKVFQNIWGEDGESVESSRDLIAVMARMLEKEVLGNKVNVISDEDEEE